MTPAGTLPAFVSTDPRSTLLVRTSVNKANKLVNEPTLRTLIDEQTIQRRVDELAAEISADYASADEIVMIGVLKGAFVFLSDLSRRLEIPRSIEFMSVSSYGEGTVSGEVRLVLDLRASITDKHVLIVEDIVDTGRTLAYLRRLLLAREPASIATCAIVRKPDRLEEDTPLDYLGFDIPDAWVVGYGLDWAERYRTLPYIAALEGLSAD